MPERRASAAEKKTVAERARNRCEYCRTPEGYAPDTFSVEHIQPQYRGGKTSLDNLALSCQGCNNRKFTKVEGHDPITEQMVPLYHPRWQAWHDHFGWSDDFTLVIGLTPTGRATVKELQLNRPGIVRLPRVLRAFGEHPPPEPDDTR